MKKYVFGLGTGRCGTLSLARLLAFQDEFLVTHEGLLMTGEKSFGERCLPLLAWEFSGQEIGAYLNSAERAKGVTLADVAFYHLNYVPYLIRHLKWTRFVCLKRDKMATIRSFLGWNKFNIFDSREERESMQLTVWHRCFPKYDVLTKEAALMRYWEDYYRQSEWLAAHYPQNFRIFSTEALNSRHGVRAILSFLDIPSERQQLLKGIRLHTRAMVAQERLRSFMRGCLKGISDVFLKQKAC